MSTDLSARHSRAKSARSEICALEVPPFVCYLTTSPHSKVPLQMLPSVFGKRGKLRPAWRFAPEGILWRIALTPQGLLVGEARTLDTKQVSFFCVDVVTGTPRWQGATFGEQWWMGIESVCGEVLLLHKYASPDMPGHKGLIAVDVASGKQMWRHEDLTFEFGATDFVLASRSSLRGDQFLQLALSTGTSVKELTASDARLLRGQVRAAGSDASAIATPVPIVALAEDFSESGKTIRNHCNVQELVGPVEFLEQNTLLIFNYHQRSSSSSEELVKVNNILKVLDRGNGTILFDTVMNTDSLSVVPETFFVRRDMLLYIHERTTLTAIDLTNVNVQ